MAKQSLNRIRKLIAYPNAYWQAFCLPLLESMSNDDLQRIRKIMTVRQSFYLPPGAAAEDIYRDRDLWTYATLVVAIQKLGYRCKIPDAAQRWIDQNALCTQTIQFALSSTPTGVLYEIITHVLGENYSNHQPKKVQTEQKNGIERLGHMFIEWLIDQLNQGRIKISENGCAVHAVEEGLIIVAPKAFKQFNQANYQAVMDDFRKLPFFVGSSNEHKWNAGSGIFIQGYLIRYDVISSRLSCDITINYELEKCS